MPDGRIRFRLWAPDAGEVTLVLGESEEPMAALSEGWFERVTKAPFGTAYGFMVDGRFHADPAARAQAGDVHGRSLLIDPDGYEWRIAAWRGLPWHETVLYELHVGTFTPEGTFRAAAARLDHLAALGITAIELMPLAQFQGRHGWGYDGVLPYAPHNAYGTPDDLKAFIDAAHERGLMVFLDVAYTHLGPEGSDLAAYAGAFFNAGRQTQWGAAIDYKKRPVRDFFIGNALYWVEEFRFDGLRFDSIEKMVDGSPLHLLNEIAQAVHSRTVGRRVHLVTEDDRNVVYFHPHDAGSMPTLFTAEWNDDLHDAAHAIATGEMTGRYADFAEDPWDKLARALAEGFAYQGESSPRFGGEPRGDMSRHQPSTAFVAFLQSHACLGGPERLLSAAGAPVVRVLAAMLLLSPQIPLLFMGEEWGETNPFLFFSDAEENAFDASKIDWRRLHGGGAEWLDFYHRLIALRTRHVVPLLAQARGGAGRIIAAGEGFAAVSWRFGMTRLCMEINLSGKERLSALPPGEVLFEIGGKDGMLKAPGFLFLKEEIAG